MASYYVRKRSRFYWLRFLKPDLSWGDKSTGIPIDGENALRRVTQLVADTTAQEKVMQQESGLAVFRAWVPAWLAYKYQKRSPVTHRRYSNAWAQWSAFFKTRKVLHPGEVTYQLCHDFMTWRTDKTLAATEGRRAGAWNTAIFETKVLSAIMQEATRRGFVMANPCTRLGLRKEKPKEKREITKEEETRILELLRAKPLAQWMAEAFLVAMRQGCRLQECRVPMDQIDDGAGVMTLDTKGGRTHTMPIHAEVMPLVAAARRAGRKVLVDVPPQASVRFQEFFAENGFPELTFHCTRVTVVTRLCRAGFSESQTMAYVGHASAVVHAVYRKLRAPDVRHLGDAL